MRGSVVVLRGSVVVMRGSVVVILNVICLGDLACKMSNVGAKCSHSVFIAFESLSVAMSEFLAVLRLPITIHPTW